MASFNELEISVVNTDACCGCGLCAGACPASVLSMQFNAFGEYRPYKQGEACTECGLCVKVCPFNPDNPDQDGLATLFFSHLENRQHSKEAGIVDRCFVGHAPDADTRFCGASGGMVTWLLREMLETGEIDHVITVQSGHKDGAFFHYQVVNDVSSINKCSKSAYYPVEMSEVIRYLLSHEGRYAIVALPCVAKGLRHLIEVSTSARQRISYIFGLVCGKNKSKYYLDALLAHLPVKGPAGQVCFRDKTGTRTANDFFFSAQDAAGYIHRFGWSQGVNRLFHQPWFDLKACRLCDDIFAECADAVFMDAWLPEYSGDPRGTNLILSRNSGLSACLVKITQPISLKKVIRSQQGVIRRKRLFLENKLIQAGRTGRAHLSLVMGWKFYLPQNCLHWRHLARGTNHADMIDALIAGKGDWFTEFEKVFNDWQKAERAFSRVERMFRIPQRGVNLILKCTKHLIDYKEVNQ